MVLLSQLALAQAPEGFLYDEDQVPNYSLPPILESGQGAAHWWRLRRLELLRLFEAEVYGRTPTTVEQPFWERVEGPTPCFNGKAVRQQVALWPLGKPRGLRLDLLLYLPAGEQPAPTFLGMNFYGNQTVYPDPDILLARGWVARNESLGIPANRATEESRGARAGRWPIEAVVARGYGVCTLYYGDVDPDRPDFNDGVHPYFYEPDQKRPGPDEWGSIGAWAWGLSRVMDYLEQEERVDGKRVIVMGHSRLGKTALWAGAQDQRFAMVISNNSGCGGAALSRRRFGETVERINTQFPHWFCANFHKFNGREDSLPVDQHQLLALIAPRPLYVTSASADLWADPRGEFLATQEAGRLYRELGQEGLPPDSTLPAPGGVLQGMVSYHLRSGRHDLTLWDWNRFMDAADQLLTP